MPLLELARPGAFGADLVVLAGIGVMLLLTALALWPSRRRPREHVGATEGWSPAGELAYVPPRPITEDERRTAELFHANERWHADFDAAETRVFRAIDETFDRLTTRAERLGHLEVDTREITFDRLRELIGGGR